MHSEHCRLPWFVTILLVLLTGISEATVLEVPHDFTTIQNAVNACSSGDTVLVHPGEYSENVGLYEYGLVLGSLFLTTGDTTWIGQTIVDGAYEGAAISIADVTEPVEIAGLTIQGGFNTQGGGIDCSGSDSYIHHNLIRVNNALQGAGMFISGGQARIEQNRIHSNTNTAGQASAGGGIYILEAEATVFENIFSDNHSERHGGALHLERSVGHIINNTFMENSSGDIGGAICLYVESTGDIIGNLIAGNQAVQGGGGIYANEVSFALSGNTIIHNSAAAGGGVMFVNGAVMDAAGDIFWDNQAAEGPGAYLRDVVAHIGFGDLENGQGSLFQQDLIDFIWMDCLDLNPQFEPESPWSWRPGPLSPCINSGPVDTTGLNLPERDLLHHPRISEERMDIGAAEFPGDERVNSMAPSVPIVMQLDNYPNPFNAGTVIRFTLEDSMDIGLRVYALGGQLVKLLVSGFYNSGEHQVSLRADELPSGIYLVVLDAGSSRVSRKILRLK